MAREYLRAVTPSREPTKSYTVCRGGVEQEAPVEGLSKRMSEREEWQGMREEKWEQRQGQGSTAGALPVLVLQSCGAAHAGSGGSPAARLPP